MHLCSKIISEDEKKEWKLKQKHLVISKMYITMFIFKHKKTLAPLIAMSAALVLSPTWLKLLLAKKVTGALRASATKKKRSDFSGRSSHRRSPRNSHTDRGSNCHRIHSPIAMLSRWAQNKCYEKSSLVDSWRSNGARHYIFTLSDMFFGDSVFFWKNHQRP